jgi:ribulose-5-phosphate 4-epimerase/fuculose-1-phosphate aldolase
MTDFINYRQKIVDYAKDLSLKGFLSATGGNLSVRIQEIEGMAITPSNYDYMKMTPGDICVLNLELGQLAGERKPSVESAMHAAIYRMRPDVNAIIHTHQVFPSTLGIIGKPIPALFDEQIIFLGRSVKIIPYFPSGTTALARTVAEYMSDHNNAYLMANHGALLLAGDMERAMHNVFVLEKCAVAYLLALCTGENISEIPSEACELAYAKLREAQAKSVNRPVI